MALDLSLLGIVLKAAGVAAAYAFYGYLTKGVLAGEKFDGEKLASTIALGAVTGAFAGYFGLDPLDTTSVETLAGTLIPFTALILLVDWGAKGLYRYVKRKLGK